MIDLPQGDLSRAVVHDPSDNWPTTISIVAYWKHQNGKRGKRRALTIPADQFFGRGGYGAPMSGDQLVGMINRLRKE